MMNLMNLSLFSGGGLLLILPVTHVAGIRAFLLSVFFISSITLWRGLTSVKIQYWPIILLWCLLPLMLLPFSNDIAFSIKEIKRDVIYGMMTFIGFLLITRDKKIFERWLLLLAIGLAFFIAWAWINYFFYGRDLESSYDWRWHQGYAGVATYVTILLPLFIPALFIFEKYKFLTLGLFFCALWMAVFSSQRAMIFVLAGQLAVLVFLVFKFKLISATGDRKIVFKFFLLAFLLVLVGSIYFMYDRLSILWINSDFLNSDVRILQFPKLSFDLIMQHPFVGHGFGRTLMRGSFEQFGLEHPHNIILSYGVALGFLGMLAITLLFFTLFYNYYKLLQENLNDKLVLGTALAGAMVVVGVFFREQFNYTLSRDLAILFWAVNGILLGFALRQGR